MMKKVEEFGLLGIHNIQCMLYVGIWSDHMDMGCDGCSPPSTAQFFLYSKEYG